MTEVPFAETPVTKPVLDTLATDGVADDQGVVAVIAAAVGEPVNWVVKPYCTLKLPEIVGSGFTVMLLVAELLQPFASV